MIINIESKKKNSTNILKVRGCLLSGRGRGRGDCAHFIGLPEVEDENTTDEYGRPHGWCEVCWRGEEIRRLKNSIFQSALAYGGSQYAYAILADASKPIFKDCV